MTREKNILLVGSLPPQPSNAAALTHAIAEKLSMAGVDVVCLIDELAPPPTGEGSYAVVRPFDTEIVSGSMDNWPRLYVVGNRGDSLPALRMMHASPGAVAVADTTLFGLAMPWLETLGNPKERLNHWLASRYGEAGRTLAHAITVHRRHARNIEREIPAFDLLLSCATAHLALTTKQQIQLAAEGFAATRPTPSIPIILNNLSNPESAAKPTLSALVVGLNVSDQQTLSKRLASGGIGQKVDLLFSGRYAATVSSILETVDIVAVMDGDDAIFCPLAAEALARGKLLITAHQPWSQTLADGSHLSVDHAQAIDQLLFALISARAVPTLFDAIAGEADKTGHAGSDLSVWCAGLLDAAKTAAPIDLGLKMRLPSPVEPETGLALNETLPVSNSVCALIGAVPAPPILAQFLPFLDHRKCPRFMTPELADLVATLMKEPAARLQDLMGFEAPLIKSRSQESRSGHNRKIYDWSALRTGLRHAREALAFGCAVDDAFSPAVAASTQTVRWTFNIPEAAVAGITDNGGIKGYETASGVFWIYDPTHLSVSALVFTGTAGTIEFSISGEDPLVITDNKQTAMIGAGQPAEFTVGRHGVAIFKVAAIPDVDGRMPQLMKILAEQGLHLKWSSS